LSPDGLAELMLEMELKGCHNINFVTPTHVVPMLIEAVLTAANEGLSLPLVYNSGGYDSVETLKLLDGVIDINMPDFKYGDASVAKHLSGVDDYPQTASAALTEMHRQVGDLYIDDRGIALRGLLVRHLVLPGGFAGTAEVLRFLADGISKNTYVNIMDQYRPSWWSHQYPLLSRRTAEMEMSRAYQAAEDAGLHRFAM